MPQSESTTLWEPGRKGVGQSHVHWAAFLLSTRFPPVPGGAVPTLNETPSDEGSLLWTLEEIGRLVSQSGDPAETLGNVVHLIQRRFGTDVCSVYLLEPDRANLVLAATIGLRQDSV